MGSAGNTPMKSAYDPSVHHRRSIRLRGHDYAGRGVYFVTICVADNRPLFGTMVNGRMASNDAGRIAARCWREIPNHFPHAALDEWIVMPDHVHGIIVLRRDGHPPGRGEKCFAPTGCAPAVPNGTFRPRGTSRTIGSIVRGFKIGVTKSLGGESPWQRNYYDIIVRDQPALNNIRAYIRNNPADWDVHRYGEPQFFAGNRALLDLPMTAFLASRTDGKGERCFAPTVVPATWPMHPECVVSGFLSPMERAVFDTCLADGIPMVNILARGLPHRFPAHIQQAIDAGRLLVMTPFDSSVDRFSAARAAWCNQYALHLAPHVVIGQLSPDGMLACLLSDISRDTHVTFIQGATAAKYATVQDEASVVKKIPTTGAHERMIA